MAEYDASIVNASPEALAALASVPDPGPFIMLNLLRYRGATGPEAYGRYARVAGREIAKLGGGVVYSAPALPGPHGGNAWDAVALVRYPQRASYLELQQSQAYQDAIPDRVAGLERRLLYVCSEAETAGDNVLERTKPVAGLERIQLEGEEIAAVNLLRFKGQAGRAAYLRYEAVVSRLLDALGARVEVSLRGELAMVSEEAWEHLAVVRYPSIAALESMVASDEWQRANVDRREGLDGTIALATRPT